MGYQPALDMIVQSGVIECLIRCFANPNYCHQLAADAAVYFAKKMEELLRHNKKLQIYGIRAIIKTLKQLRNKPYLEFNILSKQNKIKITNNELIQILKES